MKFHLSLFLPLILVLGCSPSETKSEHSEKIAKEIENLHPEIAIDAPHLFEKFRAAEAESKTKYIDQVLLVTGRVDSTKTDNSSGSSHYEVTLINDVSCYFASTAAEKIISLKAGDSVTIKGKCTNGSTSGVTLTGCTFSNKE
jgi:hypothetical protein